MFNLIYPVFNQVVWHSPDDRRNLNSLRELAGVCIAGAVVILLVLTERPIFLWVLGLISVLGVVLMFIPLLGIVIGLLLWLLEFAVWIILLLKAYQGQKFKLPVIGDMAEQQANA